MSMAIQILLYFEIFCIAILTILRNIFAISYEKYLATLA